MSRRRRHHVHHRTPGHDRLHAPATGGGVGGAQTGNGGQVGGAQVGTGVNNGSLARTGSNTGGLVLSGLVLAALGGAVLILRRRQFGHA